MGSLILKLSRGGTINLRAYGRWNESVPGTANCTGVGIEKLIEINPKLVEMLLLFLEVFFFDYFNFCVYNTVFTFASPTLLDILRLLSQKEIVQMKSIQYFYPYTHQLIGKVMF